MYPVSWGIPTVVIPQFKMNREWMKDKGLAEKLMVAIVPHDLMVWPVFADSETVTKYRDAMMRFGIGEADTRFLPYWKSDTGLTCEDARLKVSGYSRPGRVLVCVGNSTSEEIEGPGFRVDSKRLGLGASYEARDALTGEKASGSVRPKSLTLIEVR